MRKATYWAGLLVILLLTLGGVADARIADDGGMFNSATVTQLNTRISSINATYGKDVWIITVPEKGSQTWEAILQRATGGSQINGLAILLAKNDRKMDIWIGNQTMSIFPSTRVTAIKQAISSNFRQGRFDDGILAGVSQIEDTFRMNAPRTGQRPPVAGGVPAAPAPRPAQATHRSSGGGWGFGLFGLLFFLFFMAIGAFMLIALVRLVFRAFSGGGGGDRGAYSGPGYGGTMGGGGYGQGPGYGGGGGGGFWQGLAGGVGGAVVGNWLYDKFSGRGDHYHDHGSGGYSGGHSAGGGAGYDSSPAPSWTQQDTGGGFTGESSWGGDSGDSGGSWGSSSGDVGGGMDWGGGGDSGGGSDW